MLMGSFVFRRLLLIKPVAKLATETGFQLMASYAPFEIQVQKVDNAATTGNLHLKIYHNFVNG